MADLNAVHKLCPPRHNYLMVHSQKGVAGLSWKCGSSPCKFRNKFPLPAYTAAVQRVHCAYVPGGEKNSKDARTEIVVHTFPLLHQQRKGWKVLETIRCLGSRCVSIILLFKFHYAVSFSSSPFSLLPFISFGRTVMSRSA